ncbi:MAG: hypothetical protein ACK5JL_04140 [Candidatus Kapaibacterium sp.]|jgi:hypothetical protein
MVRLLTRTALIVCALVVAAPVVTRAQAPAKQQEADKKPQTVKPQMTLGDLAFTLQTLATVNITGAEVEAYVDVKNTFMKVFEQAQKDQKKESDTVSIEMTILTANNFLELFKRANLQGAAAERFLAVKNALYASAPQQPAGK